jgi:hypothetical protein
MADVAARSQWSGDAVNHGWSLWRGLVEADDPKRAIAALKRDDLRCVVLAQLLEQRHGRAVGVPGSNR